MPQLISDDVLHQYACVGKYDSIAATHRERYGGLVTKVVFSTPVEQGDDGDALKAMLSELKAA